jgi:hypothetical protein
MVFLQLTVLMGAFRPLELKQYDYYIGICIGIMISVNVFMIFKLTKK